MAYPYDPTNTTVKQARRGLRLQQRAHRRPAPVRRERRLRRDGAATRPRTRSARPNAFETTTSLARDEGDGHERRGERRRLGAARAARRLRRARAIRSCRRWRALHRAGLRHARASTRQFLDWLKGEVDAGRVQVKTVHEVVGGALQPQVAVAPAPRAHGQPARQSVVRAGGHERRARRPAGPTSPTAPITPPTVARTSDGPHAGSRRSRSPCRPATTAGPTTSSRRRSISPQCSPTAIARPPLHLHRLVQGQRPDQGRRLLAQRRQPVGAPRLGLGRHGDVRGRRRLDAGSFTFRAPAGATARQRRLLPRQPSPGATATRSTTRAWWTRTPRAPPRR